MNLSYKKRILRIFIINLLRSLYQNIQMDGESITQLTIQFDNIDPTILIALLLIQSTKGVVTELKHLTE